MNDDADERTTATPPDTLPTIAMRLTTTLAIGAVGGWILSQFHIPLAWMLGSMIAVTFVAVSRVPILERPIRLRVVMLAVLGVMLGSGFTPEVMDRVSSWIATLSAMTIYAGAVAVLGYIALRRTMGFDTPTAYFSAVPGGITDMTITGGEMGGDERTIALIHSLRIMMTVLIIPLWFRLAEGVVPPEVILKGATLSQLTLRDGIILVSIGIAGAVAGKLARLPAYPMVGAMIFSAVAHLTGVTSAKPPIEIVNAAQVVIGAAIGCRFIGIVVREVPKLLTCGVFTALYMLGAAAVTALLLEPYLGTSFAALWLAFAPGGLPEMALMSIALSVDPAFVATHHLYRVVLLIVLAPLVFRLAQRWKHRKSTEDQR